MVGIDLGVAKFAKLSDGEEILPLNSFRKQEKKLAHLQRKMTKKVNFSQNWKKLKAKVQRLHQKIASVRNDFLHKHENCVAMRYPLVCHGSAQRPVFLWCKKPATESEPS
ncbi:transposase, partial [Candidatus Hakubella thermalkaliphila]